MCTLKMRKHETVIEWKFKHRVEEDERKGRVMELGSDVTTTIKNQQFCIQFPLQLSHTGVAT